MLDVLRLRRTARCADRRACRRDPTLPLVTASLAVPPSAAAGARAGRGRRLEKHRAGAAAGDQARQQPRAAGAEEQPVDVAALEACTGAFGGDVEVLDVQAQDLVGAGGGLVEQPPQGAFAQVDVAALPQVLEARERDAAARRC
ncbi:MAG: hypothetical protein ACRDLS_10410 [Solirubrobacteraceae bacterium]